MVDISSAVRDIPPQSTGAVRRSCDLDAADQQPLFTTAHGAVRFAVTRDGKYGRPLLAKILVSDGEAAARTVGLAPLEAAAQAGMILSILRGIPRTGFAALIARVAPAVIACDCRRACCSGKRMSGPWREAIDALAVAAAPVLPDLEHRTRVALAVKLYSSGVTLARIAKESGVSIDVLDRHHRALMRWLQGSRVRGGEAVEGIEFAAWREAESLLRDAGVVGAASVAA